MDLKQTYSKIDELYAEYVTKEDKTAIKAKMLRIICNVINSDFKYKTCIENGDFDYLPVLSATNEALKYFQQTSRDSNFHSYLFCCIKKAVNKDLEQNQRKGFTLSSANIKLIKKLKKLEEQFPTYKGEKQKIAYVLGISLEKLNALILSENIDYLSKKITGMDSEKELEDFLPASNYISRESKIDFEDNLDGILKSFESVWNNIKSIHQPIISDWLTSFTLHEIEVLTSSTFEHPGEVSSFVCKYSFINKNIVERFFNDKTLLLPLTYDSIAETHGITKSAVYKKITIFIEELKKQKNI